MRRLPRERSTHIVIKVRATLAHTGSDDVCRVLGRNVDAMVDDFRAFAQTSGPSEKSLPDPIPRACEQSCLQLLPSRNTECRAVRYPRAWVGNQPAPRFCCRRGEELQQIPRTPTTLSFRSGKTGHGSVKWHFAQELLCGRAELAVPGIVRCRQDARKMGPCLGGRSNVERVPRSGLTRMATK